MKKLFAVLCLVVLLAPFSAVGEGETAAWKKHTFPVDAEYIDLEKDTVPKNDTAAFIAFLRKFPNLKKVDMYSTHIGLERIEQLYAAFPDVEFGLTMVFGTDKHLLRTDATAFSTLHGLPGTYEHEAKVFSILKYCKNLRALDLGHNLIDDLSFLYDLPKLRVLIVAKNRLTDITPVAGLKDLEYLEIFGNNITDLSPLAGLPHLIDINMTGNRIADLSPLLSIPTLRRAWVFNHNKYAPVDPEFIAKLREALPDTLIDDVSAGTEGGWRTGSAHYEVIHEMFKNGQGEYRPFDDVSFSEYAFPWP